MKTVSVHPFGRFLNEEATVASDLAVRVVNICASAHVTIKLSAASGLTVVVSQSFAWPYHCQSTVSRCTDNAARLLCFNGSSGKPSRLQVNALALLAASDFTPVFSARSNLTNVLRDILARLGKQNSVVSWRVQEECCHVVLLPVRRFKRWKFATRTASERSRS